MTSNLSPVSRLHRRSLKADLSHRWTWCYKNITTTLLQGQRNAYIQVDTQRNRSGGAGQRRGSLIDAIYCVDLANHIASFFFPCWEMHHATQSLFRTMVAEITQVLVCSSHLLAQLRRYRYSLWFMCVLKWSILGVTWCQDHSQLLTCISTWHWTPT